MARLQEWLKVGLVAGGVMVSQEELLETFREDFERAVSDQIAYADRAVSVAEAATESAKIHGRFKGFPQQLVIAEGDAVLLALSRLFEAPSDRYPARSIRSLLKFMRTHATDLTPASPQVVLDWLDGDGEQDVAPSSGTREALEQELPMTKGMVLFVVMVGNEDQRAGTPHPTNRSPGFDEIGRRASTLPRFETVVARQRKLLAPSEAPPPTA